jgi:hypothetical protein
MVDFSIIGDEFDPNLITEKLGLEPTEQYIKGEKNDRNFKKQETCWSISTGYNETLYVSELIDEIISKFCGKEEILIQLKQTLNLSFKFFIVIRIENNIKPAIYLDKKIVKFANILEAEFDFDLYIMS